MTVTRTGGLQVGGLTPTVSAVYARPADNNAYQAGDLIGNSTTAASVVPIEFDFASIKTGPKPDKGISGYVNGAKITVQCASGTIVLTNLILDLFLFPAATSIPFAAAGYPADNTAVTLTAAAFKKLICVCPFVQANWKNNIGANAAAGDVLWQKAPVSSITNYSKAGFNLGSGITKINGLLVAQGGWTPTGVVNTFTIDLDVVLD